MKLEVIIEKGRARLVNPVYLKSDAPHRFAIEIDPRFLDSKRDWVNEETSGTKGRQPEAKPGSFQERLNKILGTSAVTRAGASIGDDYQTLLDALEERYNGR